MLFEIFAAALAALSLIVQWDEAIERRKKASASRLPLTLLEEQARLRPASPEDVISLARALEMYGRGSAAGQPAQETPVRRSPVGPHE